MNSSVVSPISLSVEVARDVYWHHISPGDAWRIGRSRSCDVVLGGDDLVSAVALLLRYDVRTHADYDVPMLRLLCLQRGSGRILVKVSAGDEYRLTAGSPPLTLRADAGHQIDICTPGVVAKCKFRTPPRRKDTMAQTGGDTITWSVSRNRHQTPGWVDVAALCVAIERYPDVRPIGVGGESISSSAALRFATELFRGYTSISYSQARLHEALDKANLSVSAGQDKQARVALHYADYFSSEKISRLRDLLDKNLQAVYESHDSETN